jgi:hypothetical protein
VLTPDRERGQTLILFLVVATVILVIGVIVVDVGLWLSERRQAQSAADMAALAAASQLRNSNGAATAKGQEFARRNGFDDSRNSVSVAVTPQFNGDPDLVEVVIRQGSPSMFGQIFGFTNVTIGARAVARVQDASTSQGYAVFSDDSNCGGGGDLDIWGNNTTITGAVHSNSDIDINGNNGNYNGLLTWVCSGGFDNNGNNNSFNPAPQRVSVRTPPIDLTFGQFPCNVTFNSNVNLASINSLWVNNNPNTRQLKDNVICSTRNLSLSTSNVRGRVTLVAAGLVSISGNNLNLTPLWNNIQVFSSSSNSTAIDLDGNQGRYEGFIHAPNGGAEIQGNQIQITGSVVADRIDLRGNNVTIDGSGAGSGTPGPPSIWLIE